MTMKNRKRNRVWTNRLDSKFSSKLQTEQSTPANIIFDTQTDIIESVQETVLINDDDLDIIHNDFDIEIGHNVDTSVQCGPSHTFTSYKHRNSN